MTDIVDRLISSEPVPVACKFGWHSWSKFVDLGEGTVSLFGHGERPVVLQEKRCVHCNIVARRISERG